MAGSPTGGYQQDRHRIGAGPVPSLKLRINTGLFTIPRKKLKSLAAVFAGNDLSEFSTMRNNFSESFNTL
jgi:hypothetical protein